MVTLSLLITPMDVSLFLLTHVGTNDSAKRSHEGIISDFEADRWKLKAFGAQRLLSAILSALRGMKRGKLLR
ncbi:hypothetical protein JRQ81_017385, partial [Phrynocephalus forsythii]